MKPRTVPTPKRGQGRLFSDDGPLLRDFIDMKHELVLLADQLPWDRFDQYWREQFSDAGGPHGQSKSACRGNADVAAHG